MENSDKEQLVSSASSKLPSDGSVSSMEPPALYPDACLSYQCPQFWPDESYLDPEEVAPVPSVTSSHPQSGLIYPIQPSADYQYPIQPYANSQYPIQPSADYQYPIQPSADYQYPLSQQIHLNRQFTTISPIGGNFGHEPFSMDRAYIFSCVVYWCFGWLFGGIAYVLAMAGQNSAEAGDYRTAIRLRNASYGVSAAGIVIGIIFIGIVVYWRYTQ